MLDAESEMQDLFVHRQHTDWARFIAPRKPECPDSYRVRDNGRRIRLHPHFSGPQARRGYIQEHRFMSGSAFGYPQNFNRLCLFYTFLLIPQNWGNLCTMDQVYRLLKCGCYVSKLPICEQFLRNGLRLTTSSVIIDLAFAYLL
jgi:hypothetical protein